MDLIILSRSSIKGSSTADGIGFWNFLRTYFNLSKPVEPESFWLSFTFSRYSSHRGKRSFIRPKLDSASFRNSQSLFWMSRLTLRSLFSSSILWLSSKYFYSVDSFDLIIWVKPPRKLLITVFSSLCLCFMLCTSLSTSESNYQAIFKKGNLLSRNMSAIFSRAGTLVPSALNRFFSLFLKNT